MELEQHLRVATALAHCVPGVSLRLRQSSGPNLVVAHARLDAAMTPCQLREAVIAGRHGRGPSLTSAIHGVEIERGLRDLGAGLYERGHPCTNDERWMTTFLSQQATGIVLAGWHGDTNTEGIDARLIPDPGLGITVVCLAAPANSSCRLDSVASWAIAALLVAELTEPAALRTHP